MSPIRTEYPLVPASASISVQPEGLQPFQCSVCRKRFTRHENLKRHYAGHTAAQNGSSFPCNHCSTTFSRVDLRKRHMKRKHPEVVASSSSKQQQNSPDKSASPLSQPVSVPAIPIPETQTQTQTQGQQSIPSIPPTTNESFFHFDQSFSHLSSSSGSQSDPLSLQLLGLPYDPYNTFNGFPTDTTPVTNERRDSNLNVNDTDTVSQLLFNIPSTGKPPPITRSISILSPLDSGPSFPQLDITTGVTLFFEHASHFLPFLHRPSFNPDTVAKCLLMGVLCIGFQYTQDVERGRIMAAQCFHHSRKLLELGSNGTTAAEKLAIVQSYLLLEVYSVMYTRGNDASHGLQMHTKAVELSRRGGLMDPLPLKTHSTNDLEALWYENIHAESHKRTLFAVYQLDATWYLMLSIPRSLSHLEIKHDMPCSDDLWSASSASEWAHLKLISSGTNTTTTNRYIAAVRSCLSGNPATTLASFDAYGLLLVTLFLYASVREVSGWSTMTGRICFERFEALHNGLKALEPLIQAREDDGSQATLCEATWRMAMIELLNWSSAHTNGVVEGSVDAALASAVYLGHSQAELVTPHAVALLEPHLLWFIQYLDTTEDTSYDAPWLTVYAFKAFFITWHLARGGDFDILQKAEIGIGTKKDLQDVMAWATDVFGRRSKWEIGRLVLRSLDALELTRFVT